MIAGDVTSGAGVSLAGAPESSRAFASLSTAKASSTDNGRIHGRLADEDQRSAWPEFLGQAPRHLFFTGKGGVGKTSLATAVALALSDAGKSVLLVSTDAASNLDEILGVELRNVPTPVPGAPGLSLLNIDPDTA